MLKNDLYAICTTMDERRRDIREYFDSFEDAMQNRFKYGNWCCDKGDVYIYCYKANTANECEHWYIYADGTIGEHYNF